jgi:hypothetical protein
MIQYIYFVKCPNCEDEPFDFFKDAKDYALSCLSSKPIITQVEVDRNDFGECTASNDLGTIWSWEDMMKETDAEPATSIFTKDDFAEYDPDNDPEFTELDNSVEATPDNFKKPVPADMSIKDLVEAMEENEDEVECASCEELYPKEDCAYNEKHGWICPDCEDRVVECTWCEELYDRSECRKEVDLGWLCPSCIAAIKSRGESLTFKENDYWDFLDEDTSLKESAVPRGTVDLEYDELVTTLTGPQRDVDDWDEVEYADSFIYTVEKSDVATTIWENFLTEEDVADVPGGFESLEDDAAWEEFLKEHFDDLFEKYYQELLEYYKEDAEEEFKDEMSWSNYLEREEGIRADIAYDEYRDRQLFGEELSTTLEELEDAEIYRKRLTLCPECGNESFDKDTRICIKCGFN